LQYLDTGWTGPTMTLLLVAFILFNISRALRGEELYIRRIAGLNAIDEAIGRAAEMGKPVLMVPGLSTYLDAIAVQALNICSYVIRVAIKFANPIIMACAAATVYTAAQEVVREIYRSEGAEDQYDVDSVRFISDRQFAFAAGVSGIILRDQTAAVILVGAFFAESLIFAETANSIGAIQIAGSTEKTQTPFFIAACDYVLIGDEFYAASAYLTRQPVLVGSLTGQDWSKLLIMALMLVGCLWTSWTLGFGSPRMLTEEKKDAQFQPLATPRPAKESDSLFQQLLHQQIDPTKKPDRAKYPDEEYWGS